MQFGLSASLFETAYKHFLAGRLADAEYTVRQALAIDPRNVDCLHLLGVIAGHAGQTQASLALFEQAVALRPDFAPAHANRGVALMSLGRRDEGIESFNRSVALDPDHFHGWHGLGGALGSMDDFAGAEAAYRKALALAPEAFEARTNLGQALQRQGRLDEAIEAYGVALSQAPNSALIQYNVGVVTQLSGRPAEALTHYRRALALQPDYHTAHSNILLALNYLPEVDPQALLAEHRAFDGQQTRRFLPAQPSWPNDRDAGRRLRIGYVSGDFRIHPVGSYLVGPLEQHDRGALEVFCYSASDQKDAVTSRIAAAADGWRDIWQMTDEQAAALVRQDGIDILVDLAGHTDNNRPLLFARKPAPVQASWLGYPGTTGMSAIDYLVMDACTAPPGTDWAVESVVRLPHGRFCYTPPAYAPDVAAPSARPDGAVVFGSFNNMAKIGPRVAQLWARVLDAAPGSRLLLKWKELDQPNVRRRVSEAFAEAGVGPDRLELRAASPHEAMLTEYADVDIALDPFPFCGGVTSSEALWMGVPVVTLPQDRIASRQTLAFLHGLGLDELAAESEDDYVRIAAALAADVARRAELRQTLRPRMAAAPMNDAKVFARGLEAAYRQMWQRWCEGQGTEAITVEA
ncbi:MAG TPA: tetratricopeptide repeat protein [Caulobacteraceae bacterium]|jgi:predicted O-linked N-acetylglucosamine transferase (SPINDLY family)